jgi:CHAT domain-containing protein
VRIRSPSDASIIALSARAIVELFVSRWSLEVTFEEARAHIGFQSQRQWAKAATTRTTYDLEDYCNCDRPFQDPFYWAAFITQGMA